ncbi:RNA polymerase sigma factor [Amphibacillus sp. Q70]|uniref:RNA polymerase sigma factor n=1 Tax=Amphibacillus sp. Q70 TaxID=3453416 RepID=UPI003F82EAE8
MKTGQTQALRLLIERYKHHVFKIALSVVHNEKDAEDIAQETFIKMIDALPSYRSEGFKTWISRIALHKSIDFKRKQQRRREELSTFEQDYQWVDQDNVEQEFLKNELQQKIKIALKYMPEKFRGVIQCYYMEDMSYKEIADQLDLTESNVKIRLYRARIWMKEHWKEEDF